jgi:hypothetical protein
MAMQIKLMKTHNGFRRSDRCIKTLIFVLICLTSFRAYSQEKKVDGARPDFTGLHRDQIDVSFSKSKNSGDSSSSSLSIIFGSGIDPKTNFKILLNDTLIQTICCQTNYSIGYCVDSLGHIASFNIPFSRLKPGDQIKFIHNSNFFTINLPPSYSQFNKLKIDRFKKWCAEFIRDFAISSLE